MKTRPGTKYIGEAKEGDTIRIIFGKTFIINPKEPIRIVGENGIEVYRCDGSQITRDFTVKGDGTIIFKDPK